jgi:hypothetical protein
MGLLDAIAALVRAGYPEQTARKIATGELPMDTASRMARAADQGFNPDEVLYHGTKADFNEFAPSDFGNVGPGVYMSSNPEVASNYASPSAYVPPEGAQVMPLLTRGETINLKDYFAANPDTLLSQMADKNQEMRDAGITAIREAAGAPDRAVFDPRDIRSYFSAAFDPDYTGPNILGGAALPVVGGLLAAGQSEDADAGTLSKAAKIAALRAEANAARFGDEVDVSYRGAHVAPTADYGAPLHNLTSIIPEDVYGADGPRLYGLMDRAVDDEAFAVLRAVRGNPDAEVTMYRAVPVDAPETIADGDWVTTSRAYANQHGERALGGNYKILEEPTYARRLQSEGYPYEFGYMKNGRATVPILTATAGGTGAALAAPALMRDGVFQHGATSEPVVERKAPVRNQSGLLENITDFGDEVFRSVRHAAGPLADVFMPYEGINEYLKIVNDYDRQPTWMDRLGLLDW